MTGPDRCAAPECGNQLHAGLVMQCCSCPKRLGYCPEHGGIERTEQAMSAHQGSHVNDAKTVRCKWCSWVSEAFDPRDVYGRDRAYDAQKSHASARHPVQMRKLREWLSESSKG